MAEQLKEPYLRPNLQNQGTLPDGSEPVAECPDIWCAGDKPVYDFQTVLASEEQYGKSSAGICVQHHDNYYYLRLKNGSTKELTDLRAQLYYAPASIICWPSMWKSLAVENQKPEHYDNQFDVIKTGEIGVARAPFILKEDLAEAEKYCLLARVFSDDYINPMPTLMSPIYIAALLKKHLLWGQQNMQSIVPVPEKPEVVIRINMSVPPESCGTGEYWLLALHIEHMEQWQIEVRNSRSDSAGKSIALARQAADDDLFIGRYQLKKGYSSELAIYLYNPDKCIPTGEEVVKLDMGYIANGEEYQLAKTMDVLDPLSKEQARIYLERDGADVLPMDGVVHVGEYVIRVR